MDKKRLDSNIVKTIVFCMLLLLIATIPIIFSSSLSQINNRETDIEYENVKSVLLSEDSIGKIYKYGTYIENEQMSIAYVVYDDIVDGGYGGSYSSNNSCEYDFGYGGGALMECDYYIGIQSTFSPDFSLEQVSLYWKVTQFSSNPNQVTFTAVTNNYISNGNGIAVGKIYHNDTFFYDPMYDVTSYGIRLRYFNVSSSDENYLDQVDSGNYYCKSAFQSEAHYHYLADKFFIGYCDDVSNELNQPRNKYDCWEVASITDGDDYYLDINLVGTECATEDQLTDYTINVVWEGDNDNEDNNRPSKIIANFSDGQKISILPSDSWTEHLINLPKYDKNGNLIDYSVETPNTPNFYHLKSVTVEDNVTTITYVYDREMITISGHKIWDDCDNQDSLRPDSITLRIIGSGINIVDNIGAGANGNWDFSYELPKYRNGIKVNYNLRETQITGYDNALITKISEENNIITYTITNKHVCAQTSIKVEKEWDDNNNQDGKRPKQVTVNLLANDSPYLDNNGNPVTITLNEENNWSYTLNSLPKNKMGTSINYSISEVSVENYNEPVITKISETDTLVFYKIVNSKELDMTEVKVEKEWDDNDNQDGKRPEQVTVNLLANGDPYLDSDGNPVTITLNEENNWSYTFTNLYKNMNGQIIEYSVTEDEVESYNEPIIVKTSSEEDAIISYKITNHTNPATKSVTVTNFWEDNNNSDNTRPKEIEIVLLSDGNPVYDSEGEPLSATLSEEDNWTYTFTDLPKYNQGELIVYSVVVQQQDNYSEPEITLLSNEEDQTQIQVLNVYQPKVVPDSSSTDNQHQESNEVENPLTLSNQKLLIIIIMAIIISLLAIIKRQKIKNN